MLKYIHWNEVCFASFLAHFHVRVERLDAMFRRLFRIWLGIALALVPLATILTIIVIVMQLSDGSLVISPTPKW